MKQAMPKGSAQFHPFVRLPRPSRRTKAPVIAAARPRCSETWLSPNRFIHTKPMSRLPSVEPKMLEPYVQLTPRPAREPDETAKRQSNGITEPISAETAKNAGAESKNHIPCHRACTASGVHSKNETPFQ